MSKIDTKEWGEFLIGDLFELKRGGVKGLQLLSEGETPVIAAAGYKQGVAGYYNVAAEYSNKITVSCNGAGCGSTFYHAYPFNINGDAMVLIEKKEMSDMVKRYISCLLNGVLTRKYSYAEKCSPQKAEKEKIKLPIKNGQPDYEYMESFMASVEDRVKGNLAILKTIS